MQAGIPREARGPSPSWSPQSWVPRSRAHRCRPPARGQVTRRPATPRRPTPTRRRSAPGARPQPHGQRAPPARRSTSSTATRSASATTRGSTSPPARGRPGATSGSGHYGTGPQPIEFNSNGILVVGRGRAGDLARDPGAGRGGQRPRLRQPHREPRADLGPGERGDLVRGRGRPARKNVVDNYGTSEQINGGTVIGTSGGSGIDFYNQTGARVEGSLASPPATTTSSSSPTRPSPAASTAAPATTT